MIGMTSGHTNNLWRSEILEGLSRVTKTPLIHEKFATMDGEAAIAGIEVLLNLHHAPHLWDDPWRSIVVEHPMRDA